MRVDRSSYFEMIPRLNVVPGKKTTAFGLGSPKRNRRRLPAARVDILDQSSVYIYLSIHPPVHPSINPPINTPTYPSMYL